MPSRQARGVSIQQAFSSPLEARGWKLKCAIFPNRTLNAPRCSKEIGAAPSTISSPSFPPNTGSTATWMSPASRLKARSSTTSARPGQKNATGFASFLGAGAYRHYRPVIIDSLVQRGEFLTSYTPYQAEITQGTLQAIFEFQTMIAELTGMDVANASMYDGSTGAAEAVMMAMRVTGRHKAVVAATVHPEYREVLATYAKHQGLPVDSGGLRCARPAAWTWPRWKPRSPKRPRRCWCRAPISSASSKIFPAIAAIAHAKGALLIVSIAEAVSLGVVRPPVEADIVSMEAQSFGVALSYGGPFCGVIAAKEQYVRQMPGRLVGQTVDRDGYRGFVLTLATREQHIRREKATSNICTNQALVALMATIFSPSMAKKASANWPSTTWPRRITRPKRWAALPGAKLLFDGRAALPRVCFAD